MKLSGSKYILFLFLLLSTGMQNLLAQCPDPIESNKTIVVVDETCDGAEDGFISIDFVTAAGIYEPSLGDLDPTGGYRYALWDASLANYVYDDIGVAPPTSPINPNIFIEFNSPNNVVFRNLPPNPGFAGFGYFIVAERQDGNNCIQIYVSDPLGMPVGPGEPLPTATLSGGGNVCADDPLPDVIFNFTGTAPYDFTYTVSGTPVNVVGHPADVFSINSAAPGNYGVVSLTDGNGCTGIDLGDSIDVVVNPIPVPTISGPDSLCFGETGIYTTESGSGESNYIWAVIGGTIVNGGTINDPTIEVRWDGLGPFYISVNYNNVFGCDAATATNYPISVHSLPVPTINGPSDVCIGSTQNYSTESGSGETNYIWSVSGGTIVNGGGVSDPTIEITWDGTAPYEISILYTDVNGCTPASPTILPINVNPLPIPVISGSNVVCEGSVETYSTDSGSGESNYIWTISGGTVISGGTPADATVEIQWDGAAPYEVSVNYTSSAGCTATAPSNLAITVNPLPLPVLTGSDSVCSGSTQIYSTDSLSGESNYQWIVNGGTVISGGTTSDPSVGVLWDGSAPFEVMVSYTNASGCTALSPTVLPVNVIPLPIPSLDGSSVVCFGALETYSTDSTAGQSNFIWNISGGTIINGGTVTDPSVTVLWDGSAPHQVSIGYTDVNGCSSSSPSQLPVVVNTLPVPGITGPSITCFGSTEIYNTESGGGNSNYNWSVSGGTIVSGGTATDPVIEILWGGVAPHEVSVNYQDANGCTASSPAIQAIAVNARPSNIIFTGDTAICEGESADLNITITGGTVPYTAYLSLDGGTTVVDSLTIPDSNPYSYNTGSLNSNTVYSITSITDASGCSPDPSDLPPDVVITVNPAPDVTFSMPSISGDVGDQYLIPVTVQGFINMINTSFTITWDESIIRYLDIENLAGISDLDLSDFNLVDSSTLTFQWAESASAGQSIPDGQSLFEIRFELIGPDCFASSLLFSNNPVSISAQDENSCTVNLNLINGSVNVGGSGISAAPVMNISDSISCINDPSPQLSATGTNVRWYSDPGLTNLIETGNIFNPVLDTSLPLDTLFYATQTIGTCSESPSDSTRLRYNDVPVIRPVPGQNQYEICVNDPAPTLVATGTGIQWYTDPGLTNLVGLGNNYTPGPGELDTSIPDTVFFYMVQSNNCGAGPYDSTAIHIKDRSYPPVAQSIRNVCVGASQPTLTVLGTNIRWYTDSLLTTLIATGNNFTPDSSLLDMSSTGVYAFYATQDDGCGESFGTQLIVNVIWCITDCSGISASVNIVDPGCNSSNGEIQISATGGTGFYTYQLIDADSILLSNQSGIFNNLTEGVYVYEIVDDTAACITPRDTVSLSDPLNIAASADTSSFVNSFCYGEPWGRAIINVTGGSGVYEYSINGNTWLPFTSGTYIDSLPPIGTYIILVREDASSICYEQVTVTIENEYPEIEFDYLTTEATCDNNDGSISITSLTGGLAPYEISYEFDPFVSVDINNLPVITGVGGGLKSIRIRDVNNCVVEDPDVMVDFPGYLIADVRTASPSCNGGGKDGQIRIFIDSAANIHEPPYQFGIASGETPESEVVLMPLASNTVTVVDTLSNGEYYVILASATACTSRTDVTISGGPTPIFFEITDVGRVPCKTANGTGTGSVTIDRVTGDTTQFYVLELISIPDSSVVFTTSLTQAEISGGYTIDGSVTNQIMTGNYVIRLSQNQSGCNLSMTSFAFEISEPEFELDFEVLEVTASWSDAPSGTANIRILPSGGNPYETRIETLMSNFPGQDIQRDWVEVYQEDGAYEFTHEELYSGIYEIGVRDAYGCEIYKEVTIENDESIFIPNIFTPNNDAHNDYFVIRNLPVQGSGTVLVISNRWGKTVYESEDYNSGNLWDGGDNPDGTYYYRIEIPNIGTYKGWVEIWRGKKR